MNNTTHRQTCLWQGNDPLLLILTTEIFLALYGHGMKKYYSVFEEIADASPVFCTVQKEVGQS